MSEMDANPARHGFRRPLLHLGPNSVSKVVTRSSTGAMVPFCATGYHVHRRADLRTHPKAWLDGGSGPELEYAKGQGCEQAHRA